MDYLLCAIKPTTFYGTFNNVIQVPLDLEFRLGNLTLHLELMMSLLYSQGSDLCLTAISETKSGRNQLLMSFRSVTPLSHICGTENSIYCLKWAPKNVQSTNCIPMNPNTTWGSLWGQRAGKSPSKGVSELR